MEGLTCGGCGDMGVERIRSTGAELVMEFGRRI